jgi:hypothetical protein
MEEDDGGWGMDLGSGDEWEDQGDLTSSDGEPMQPAYDAKHSSSSSSNEHTTTQTHTHTHARARSSSSGGFKNSPALTFMDPVKHEAKVREKSLKSYTILSEDGMYV